MKKIFTLVVMALLAVSANARTPLELKVEKNSSITFGNWEWKDLCVLATGEATVTGSTADDSGITYFDASAHDYLVLKYKECSVNSKFIIQYDCKGTAGQYGAEYYEGSVEVKANSSGLVAIKLDAHKNKVLKIAFQTQGDGSVIFEDLYWASEAEYTEDVAANPVVDWYPETVDFLGKFSGTKNDDGTVTFKNASTWNWNGAWFGDYDASYYSYAVVELAEPVAFVVQLAIQHGSGDDISTQVQAGQKAAILELSANKNHIKQAALQNGAIGDFTVKAVYFATDEYIKKNRDNILYGDTQDVALSSLSPWKEGEVARATFDAATGVLTITGDPDGGAGWWQGSLDCSHFDNFVVELAETTAEGAVVVQYVAEESAALTRANTEKKVEFGVGATCIVVALDASNKNAVQQMWIQGNKGASYTIKKAYFAVASATPEANIGTITGISSIENALQNNGLRYNLAGQKVDASYKGVVIENGKKILVK